MPFVYIKPKGGVVELDDEDFVPIVENWEYCLIGCFSGRFPGAKAVYDIKKSWGVDSRVIPHSRGWTIFGFKSLQDREKVYGGGPYMAWGKTLMLKKLDDGTILGDDLFLDIPVWVKFYDVPLKYWNPKALGKIASKLGRPLYSDEVTNECSKATYARILVEVDVRDKQTFEYEVKVPGGFFTHVYLMKTIRSTVIIVRSLDMVRIVVNHLGT
ncbi:hypothetical protein LIER_33702 [Lithospermum erythrorhizon]|uniref:DUF4283 domain-containing protein n=1 Tax=Lithospermum erythrorhizon TaxID=34254 RepID=A0AAV3RYC4_LITER